MSLDLLVFLAVLGMALATYATRVGGVYLIRGVTVRGKLKTALDALPPAILMAVIAPTILTTGMAETAAAAITATVALMRLPMVVVILTGVVSVVALRMVLS